MIDTSSALKMFFKTKVKQKQKKKQKKKQRNCNLIWCTLQKTEDLLNNYLLNVWNLPWYSSLITLKKNFTEKLPFVIPEAATRGVL